MTLTPTAAERLAEVLLWRGVMRGHRDAGGGLVTVYARTAYLAEAGHAWTTDRATGDRLWRLLDELAAALGQVAMARGHREHVDLVGDLVDQVPFGGRAGCATLQLRAAGDELRVVLLEQLRWQPQPLGFELVGPRGGGLDELFTFCAGVARACWRSSDEP